MESWDFPFFYRFNGIVEDLVSLIVPRAHKLILWSFEVRFGLLSESFYFDEFAYLWGAMSNCPLILPWSFLMPWQTPKASSKSWRAFWKMQREISIQHSPHSNLDFSFIFRFSWTQIFFGDQVDLHHTCKDLSVCFWRITDILHSLFTPWFTRFPGKLSYLWSNHLLSYNLDD